MDPFSIFSLLGGIAGGIGSMFKPKMAAGFTSEEEYKKANQEFLDALKRGDRKRAIELQAPIQAWEQQKERTAFGEEQRGVALQRLGEGEARGVKAIKSNLYARGLRGAGDIYSPVEDLRKQVAQGKADIAMGRRQEKMLTEQGLAREKTMQNFELAGGDVENISQGLGLGLGAIGEFRQGGAFGGESEWEKYLKKMNRGYGSNPQTNLTKVMGSKTYGQNSFANNTGYGDNVLNKFGYGR